ncbi:MAG: glycoside hydrolase family 1 protein [Coriobacteriales bacterium]|nr:glycoside hydrolase family 1 protein [Coriobacteriales bacterium]
MLHKTLKPFPEDFFWGASTSAYQVEGASLTNGKGPSVQDVKEPPAGTSGFEVAADQYHHYAEDVALMAEMGFKMYRFSISWSRLLPEGTGRVNEEGVEYYNNLINACLEHNITPLVTMYHFDLPQALEEKGGWANRDTVDAFVEFSQLMFSRYGDRVHYWLTINEQNMMTLAAEAVMGIDFSKFENPAKHVYEMNHNMLLAQAKAMCLCHSMLPDSKIGPAPNIALVYPASDKPEDIMAAQNFNALRNWLYLDMAVYGIYNHIVWAWLEEQDALPSNIQVGDMEIMKAAKPDFIAFNYYSTATVAMPGVNEDSTTGDQQRGATVEGFFKGVANPNLPRTEFNWEIDPTGFRNTLREVYGRYHLPIIITENGLGAYDKLEVDEDGNEAVHDPYRINYLRAHIEQMRLAISDGVEMMGYNPWSAIDLISTHEGIVKRYGFIYVNRDEFDLKDLHRVRKDSFFWYKKVIESNGDDLA